MKNSLRWPLFLFTLSALLLVMGCGKKKLIDEKTKTIENQMIKLDSLEYERTGECGDGTTHKIIHVGGIISTPDQENFFVNDFQIALYFDERRYDFYESRYSGAGNDTSYFHEERDTGLLEVLDDSIKLVGLGTLKLEFDGDDIRPILELESLRVPDVPRRDYVARVAYTSTTKIYPGCLP